LTSNTAPDRKSNIEELQYEDILKTDVLASVLSDVDVLYNWSVACTGEEELEDEGKTILLNILVTRYLRVRGFSFIRSFMESFKQHHVKGTQKSKALRKMIK
jgi:hypothetical protein